ncbi:Mitogen-activated protein kinase kinase kinase 18 [Camellia lanceoleosa]|uniref:Mitogen-activated protein kinase kinase kinase 18 n=1 Tax=Camellia lanceoleosa TaxID=1840588 RepID=A0ACC0F9A3_9ERIC|nr:Mitogen-activated protein kinase kinase kinase 18 [Camellia lanceoleosa]
MKSGGCGLPESDVRYYARSILRGLNRIHQCGYVHCDLKPENVLLVPNTTGSGTKFKMPWVGKEDLDAEVLLRQIGEGHELPKVPSEVSKEGREFLKGCFARKSMYRLTTEMLLNHSFVEGLVEDDGEIEEGEEILVPDEVGLSFMLYETDEECSYSSSSDDCTFVSEEFFLSSWSDEAYEIDTQEFSGFAEEGTLEDQENTDTTSSTIALTSQTGV